ncbi:tetratricopeptide repeat protein [Hymenobacter convexus]|uniref:tetratricopeptide repeat protein n=1 Tax=Hymenobacter sp. CA1UV-4 TaxID=3063782 RepID=UPI002713CB47|nr:tetratricopeptide repeat protein [Hymenobacter sp. CA1UV-4]MDO7851823.1 tetratricopeptide repeat protein [Hymenobacter sp. CA1UV-4]
MFNLSALRETFVVATPRNIHEGHIPDFMKKTFLTAAVGVALVAGLPATVSAQTSAVTNAILNQRSGLLDKARTDIDKAIVNEKTSGKAKTWYTRGEIYQGMLDSPIYGKQLQPGEGLQKSYESFAKTIELDTKDGEFGKQAVARLDNLYGHAFNDAVNSYNAKDYDKAIENYKLASKLKPQDTTAVLYSAYAYEAKQDYAGAKASYNQLLGMNYKSATLYSRLFQMAKQQKDDAEAAKVLQQALAAYPNNKAFMLEDLNLSLATGKGGDALDKITKAIAADPSNSNLYAVRGSMYDQQKKTDLALADYKKSVELDPNNFDAQFNLGVYNYNKAAEAYTKASKMDLKTYNVSGKKLEADGKKYFQASVPYFEKALELQPQDKNTLSSLQKVYFRLGRTADSERLNARLEQLKK